MFARKVIITDILFYEYEKKIFTGRGLTAAALLVAKPMKIIAGVTEPFINAGKLRSLVILHSNCKTATEFSAAATALSSLYAKGEHILLVNASEEFLPGTALIQEMTGAGYHAILATRSAASFGSHNIPFVLSSDNIGGTGFADYAKVISLGNMNIGVIGTAAAFNRGTGIINRINELAKSLKEEKKCTLVICVSSLGFRGRKISDHRLAKNSKNIDVIISSNNEKQVPPQVIRNLSDEEVLLDNAGGITRNIGRLNIMFNEAGMKNNISFG